MSSCAPSDLVAAARCVSCLPVGIERAVRVALLCEWANKEVGPVFPCGVPSDTIEITGAGMVGANQIYTFNDPARWIGSDPTWELDLISGIWYLTSGHAMGLRYIAVDFPCTWVVNTGDPPAPTGHYV